MNRSLLITLLFAIQCFGQMLPQSSGFIENKGQLVEQKGNPNPAVKYLLNTDGLNVQLRQNGFSYDVYEIRKSSRLKKDRSKKINTAIVEQDTIGAYAYETLYHRVDIDFIGSNPDVNLITRGKSSDYENYYNVPSAVNGILDVHQYQSVTYQNIYPDIDVIFFLPDDKSKAVEYNFIVKPNGRIGDIQLKFNGVKTELADNKIKMNVRFGAMEETLPMSWVEDGKDRRTISIGYKKIRNNVYGFESFDNLTGQTIIIDPTPTRLWGTYCGGNNMSNVASSINVDSSENVLLTGTTYCSNIATSGAFITNNSSFDESGFIIKFNPSGQRIWASYIKNGNLFAKINDAKVNSTDDIYVVGKTWDGGSGVNDLATPGSHKQFPSILASEGFILKFDSNGTRIWGTFFGGDGTDIINSLVLDSTENIVICGSTDSNLGIALPGGFLPNRQLSATYDNGGFFCKFSPAGTQLYGSYFYTSISNCVKDAADNYYFGGVYVKGVGYPDIATAGCHQFQYYNLDSYLAKFNFTFNLDWCTYYGGNGYESVTGLGTDNQNNIYLIGTTNSKENIATSGSFKDTLISGDNTYVAKFNTNGQRIWGTYFGKDGNLVADKCNNGFVKDNGDIFITGETRSTDISTPNAFQTISNGSDEGFFAKFTTSGNLSWCSYYGTPSQDYSQKIYYKNHLYISGFSTGVATNGNNLGTLGTFMPNGGGHLLFLAKFQDCLSPPVVNSLSNICIGDNLNLTASGGTGYSWTGPNGFTSNIQNPTINNANASHSGQYSCTITGTGDCDGTVSLNVIVGDVTKPVPDVVTLPTITGNCTTVVSVVPTATDNCAGVVAATTTDALSYSLPGNYTIHWNYTDGNGNTQTQTQSVIINAVSLPTALSAQTFCIQQNATLNDIAITGLNIKWYDTLTGGNLLVGSTVLQQGVTYYASQTDTNSCESSRIPVTITVQNTPPAVATNQTFCATQNPTLAAIVVNGTAIKWYDSLTNTTVLSASTLLTDGTTYYTTQTINGCESVNRIPVTVSLLFSLNAVDYATLVCDTGNDGSESVTLSDYEANLIVSVTGNTFSYYNSAAAAENQTAAGNLSVNQVLSLGITKVYVRIESVNGCHQVVQLVLTLVSEPVISIPDEVILCERSSITVNAGTGFDSYLWSTGATTPSIIINQAGSYTVTVTQNHGAVICSSTKNFSVILSNAPTITSIGITDWTDNQNSITVTVDGLIIGDYEYSIDGIHYQSSSIFNGLVNGSYQVYVRDTNGCGIDTEWVYLLNYPKFFTPNGDGINDAWGIKNSNHETNFEVRIFDRYGKLIKVMGSGQYWDGTSNGKLLLSDDYWFSVTRNDGRVHKGHFALKR